MGARRNGAIAPVICALVPAPEDEARASNVEGFWRSNGRRRLAKRSAQALTLKRAEDRTRVSWRPARVPAEGQGSTTCTEVSIEGITAVLSLEIAVEGIRKGGMDLPIRMGRDQMPADNGFALGFGGVPRQSARVEALQAPPPPCGGVVTALFHVLGGP